VSFTSAYPANLAKLSWPVQADIARGVEVVSYRYVWLPDAGAGRDAGIAAVPVSDACAGRETAAPGPIVSDRARGAERVGDRRVQLPDRGRGSERVPLRLFSLPARLATAEAHALAPYTTAEFPRPPPEQYEEDVASVEAELARVARGMPARAAAWRAIWRVAFDAMNNFLLALYYIREVLDYYHCWLDPIHFDWFFRVADRCWGLVQGYRKPRTGEIASPRITNDLIDAARCLKDLLLALWRLEDELSIVLAYGVCPMYGNTLFTMCGAGVSRPGGYFKTPPLASYTSASATVARGALPYIKNYSQNTVIYASSTWQGRPCARAYVAGDGWTVVWFEDRCLTGRADWDYDDVAVAFRLETLDGRPYLHVITIDGGHRDTNQLCIKFEAVDACFETLGAHGLPPACVGEHWIAL
jgi:hypothetical protein